MKAEQKTSHAFARSRSNAGLDEAAIAEKRSPSI